MALMNKLVEFLFQLFLHPLRINKFFVGFFPAEHLPSLEKSRCQEDPTDHPADNMLIPFNTVCNKHSAKNKKTIANKSADTNTQDICIIVIIPGQ